MGKETSRFLAAILVLVCGVTALLTFPAMAQERFFPLKPVHILVALSPGSATDVAVRAVAGKLGDTWHQPVIVENRPGGAGAVAGQALLQADPDGHTLMAYSDGYAVNAALNANLPYDTLRDIARVSQLATFSTVLVTSPGSGIMSVKDLVALAKAHPGSVTFGSAGVGGGLHFSAEIFKMAAGIEATHIPYKGTPEALTDVLSGRVHFMFAPIGSALGFIKSEKLIALATGSAQRSPLLPNLPTVSETGVSGVQYELWAGLFAPAKTPASVRAQISRDIANVMAISEMRESLARQGFVYRPNTPEEFDRQVRSEVELIRKVAAAAHISIQ